MDRLIVKPWADLLIKEMQKDYFLSLWKFVEYEYTVNICYPPAHKIFAALNECPPNKVKAVILGQDPYHTPGAAMGLAFSVPETEPIPHSLVNIYKEIDSDLGKLREELLMMSPNLDLQPADYRHQQRFV